MESTSRLPGEKVRLVSPTLSEGDFKKCLRFQYNINGRYIGSVQVLDANRVEFWSRHGTEADCKILSAVLYRIRSCMGPQVSWEVCKTSWGWLTYTVLALRALGVHT